MKINRCAICDYTERDGSSLTDKAPRQGKKVRWNRQHREFQCSDCAVSISQVKEDYERFETD